MLTFDPGLTRATLIKRYKRFLADVTLPDGQVVTAHCANSGSMRGCADPGMTVYLSPNTNPKAKLDWRWELVEVDGHLVGINTARPNRIVEAAVAAHSIPELADFTTLRREMKYGKASRIDLLLEKETGDPVPGLTYVEIKNVTLKQEGHAAFPDAVTERGRKHLFELMDMVRDGHRSVLFFLVNRGDCSAVRPADSIDPAYGEALRRAVAAGVEVLAYDCAVTPSAIRIRQRLPLLLD